MKDIFSEAWEKKFGAFLNSYHKPSTKNRNLTWHVLKVIVFIGQWLKDLKSWVPDAQRGGVRCLSTLEDVDFIVQLSYIRSCKLS